MTGLWVPPRVGKELTEATDQHNAEVVKMVQRFQGVMRHWTEAYQRELNDPRLEIIFWPPHERADLGLSPGRYHVLRHNPPPAPVTVEPIQDPVTGGFAEPGTWHIELMRESDLQNPQMVREHEDNRRKAEQAKERERERDKDERHEHLRDAFNARFRTSISMDRSTPWSQNSSPAARRDAGSRKRKG